MIENLSEDIENGIIFYLLTDKKFLQICRTRLGSTLFKSSIQQQICKIIYNFWDKYETIINGKADEIILPEFRENEQEIIVQYLTKLFSETYTKEYIQDKLDLFIQKREWEKVLIESVELLDKNNIEAIETKVQRLIRNKFNYSDVKNILEEDLKDFYNNEHLGEICCPTGIKALDSIIGGLKYKELTVIVAPLNVGKSFFITFIGSRALLHGKTVLHITTEMSRHKVLERYFMRFAGVTDKPQEELSIWSGKEKIKFSPDHLGNAKKVKKSIKTMNSFGGKLYIVEYPDQTLTPTKIERLLNDMEIEQGRYPDLLLVDGLQGLKYDENKRGEDWKNLGELTHQLRRIAMEKHIAVVTTTHSQRGSIGNKIIKSSDIRGSVDILNICDFGISINQTSEEYLLDQLRLFVMRSRSSKKWTQIRCYTNYKMGNFCTYSELVEE